MTDIPRKKTLEELKSTAIAELERRGYDVRGKTPSEIRQMLKRRPKHETQTTPSPFADPDVQFSRFRFFTGELRSRGYVHPRLAGQESREGGSADSIRNTSRCRYLAPALVSFLPVQLSVVVSWTGL